MKPTDLRLLRESAGLTMKDASRLFKVPYRTWQNWESDSTAEGRRVPLMAMEILRLYIQSKDTSIEELTGHTPETVRGIHLCKTMIRFFEAGNRIPEAWVDELREL